MCIIADVRSAGSPRTRGSGDEHLRHESVPLLTVVTYYAHCWDEVLLEDGRRIHSRAKRCRNEDANPFHASLQDGLCDVSRLLVSIVGGCVLLLLMFVMFATSDPSSADLPRSASALCLFRSHNTNRLTGKSASFLVPAACGARMAAFSEAGSSISVRTPPGVCCASFYEAQDGSISMGSRLE